MTNRIQFTVYDAASGRIMSSMTVYGEDERIANTPAGMDWIEGYYDPSVFYVKNGVAKAYPAKPGDWAFFNIVTEAWEDPRTAEDLAAELEAYRVSARSKLIAAVNAARAPFLTQALGQEMIYLAKQMEAQAYMRELSEKGGDETLIQMSSYPWMVKEVGKTAPTAYHIAQIWLGMKAMLETVGPEIEDVRLTAQTEISSVTTTAEIDLALSTAVSSLQAIFQ